MSKPVLQVSPLAVVVISDPTLPSSVPLLSLTSQQLAAQLTTPPFSILSSLDVSDAILAWLSPDPPGAIPSQSPGWFLLLRSHIYCWQAQNLVLDLFHPQCLPRDHTYRSC